MFLNWNDAICNERQSIQRPECLQGLETKYWPRLISSHPRVYRYIWHAVPPASARGVPHRAPPIVPPARDPVLHKGNRVYPGPEVDNLFGFLPDAYSPEEQAEIAEIARSLFD